MSDYIDYLQTLGPSLIRNGYDIYPCKRANKGIFESGWQDNPLSMEQLLERVNSGEGDSGISILTKNTPAVDIDVYDQVICARMVNWLICNIVLKQNKKNELIRVGQQPKALMLFKADIPFKKMKSTRFIDNFGKCHAIEILGEGQQFVAFNLHQVTKKDYEWVTHCSPDNTHINDLPTLTYQDAQAIICEFERLAIETGWEPYDGSSATSYESQDDECFRQADFIHVNQQLNTDDKSEYQRIEKSVTGAIDYLIDDEKVFDDRELWIKLTHALATAKGTQFEELFEHQFKKITTDLDKDGHRWESCSPNNTTWAVILSIAKQKGWSLEHKPQQKLDEHFFRSVGNLIVTSNDWLIRSFVEKDAFTLVFGPSGSKKSFCVIDWALCIATGVDWNGYQVKQGPVFYISGEGSRGFAKRTTAWSMVKGVDINNAPLYLSQHAVTLMDEKNANAVLEKIEEVLKSSATIPQMIVIDTLHNCYAGNENDASDMGDFLRCLNVLKIKYQCSIVIVHHTGKVSNGEARGSSSLKAAVDAEYLIESSDDNVFLTNTKMKDAEIQPTHYFEVEEVLLANSDGESLIDDFGKPFTSLVLKQVRSEQIKRLPTGKNQKAIYKQLKEFKSNSFDFIDSDYLKQACCLDKKLMTKKAFDSSLEGMIANHYIKQSELGELSI